MRAEVAEFYGFNAWVLSPRELAEAHANIPAMEGIRKLRDEEQLTPYGVEYHGTRAYGKARGIRLRVRRVTQLQAGKNPK